MLREQLYDLGMLQMALKKLQAAKDTLQNPDVGQRVKDEGKRAFAEWKAQHEQALDVIQELYITYFSQTIAVYKGVCPLQGGAETSPSHAFKTKFCFQSRKRL